MDTQGNSTELRLQCDRELAMHIHEALKGMLESRCRIADRRNVYGEASTCVLLATLAIKELPVVIAKLKELAAAIPIRRVQYGDIKASNINSDELISILAASANAKGTKKAKSSE